MIIQIGNKVQFLNEKGEGIVKRFINKTLVAVEVEDGFEIPVPVNQLVLVRQFSEEQKQSAPEEQLPAEPVLPKQAPSGPIGVFLAFQPHDIFSSSFDMHMVNNTRFDLLFSLSVRQKMGDIGLVSGIQPSQSYKTVYKTTKAELDSWSELFVQVLFHNAGPFRPISPVDRTYPVKSQAFGQVQLLKKAPLVQANCYLWTVADMGDIKPFSKEMVDSSFTVQSVKDKLSTEPARRTREKLNKHIRINPKSGNMEVDLHIEELLDDYSGLSNGEIVSVQLQQCRKAMETALAANARKITIIHGVGNGTLKNEVRSLLQEYDNIRFFDAPYEKFGYGATEVLLK